MPAPVRVYPFETLQAFQDSLRDARDLNNLLGAFVQSLHRDAGFRRVGLALLNPSDSDQPVGRLVVGSAPHRSLSPCSIRLAESRTPALSERAQTARSTPHSEFCKPAGEMNQEFVDRWKPASAILAPLRVGAGPSD